MPLFALEDLCAGLTRPGGALGLHLSQTPHKTLQFFSCADGKTVEHACAPEGFMPTYATILAAQTEVEHLEIWPGVAITYHQERFSLQPLSGPLVALTGAPAHEALLHAIFSDHAFQRPLKAWHDLTRHDQIGYVADLGEAALERLPTITPNPLPSLVQHQGLRAWCVPPQKASPMLCAIRKS